jgi:hypothetical protein
LTELRQSFQDFCGYTAYDGVGRYIGGDDGTGGYYGMLADVDTRQNDGISSYPYVVGYRYGAR